MRWTVHGERQLYRSPWVSLSLVDVEVPGGRRYEHHTIGAPDAAGVVVHDPERGVLLLWRHRFLGDEWAWEVPGGMIEEGESPEEAARRECREESGWAPGPLRLLHRFRPVAGMSRQEFWVFGAEGATPVGSPPSDEAERVEWVPMDRVERIVADNQVLDGLSVIALLHVLRGATGT
jgi:8-oxo-dGTP pyrophosphatase MutT (NUDIX family)